eukprot:10562034-Alexandrium_andersonii.AAC.1
MSGRPAPTCEAAHGPSDLLPDAWAGAGRGCGWADPSFDQGRPQECSVDLHVCSDTYSALDLEAQPQGGARLPARE